MTVITAEHPNVIVEAVFGGSSLILVSADQAKSDVAFHHLFHLTEGKTLVLLCSALDFLRLLTDGFPCSSEVVIGLKVSTVFPRDGVALIEPFCPSADGNAGCGCCGWTANC